MENIIAAEVFHWLRRAAQLPGKSPLHMALFIQNLGHKYKRTEFILLERENLRLYGFSRMSAYRSLVALEQAELIQVHRQRGTAPKVTIINFADSEATK